MSSVTTYSAEDVSFLIGGWTAEGWDKITITHNAKQFKTIRGIRGKNSRTRNKDSSVVIEVETVGGNQLSKVFEEVVNQDLRYGTAKLTVQIKDLLGHELFFSSDVFVEGYAKRDYQAEVSNRVWTLNSLSSSISSGGDGLSVSSIVDQIRGVIG